MRSERMSSKGRWGTEVAVLAVVLGLGAGCGGPVEPEAAPAVGAAEQATRGFLPDLTVTEITRDSTYFKVKYCNLNSYSADSSVVISLRNELTGASFNSVPLSAPAPGACLWTGGMSCTHVGMECDEGGTVTAKVDALEQVTESYEFNNELTVMFPEDMVRPDLVVEEVIRTNSVYHARFCNRGNRWVWGSFGVDWVNWKTGANYTPSTMHDVPQPGECAWSTGVYCTSLGASCYSAESLRVTVDGTDIFSELDETNNTLFVDFTPDYTLPDLTVGDIWRAGGSYYVSYCNRGSGTSATAFTLKVTNTATGRSFQPGPGLPLAVPPPGRCAVTDAIDCSILGCGSVRLNAYVDTTFNVFETNEGNNHLTLSL
ncbi:hypothetical protein P2318_03050 [Myxococcaceae bacterium GXIMD 01537]